MRFSMPFTKMHGAGNDYVFVDCRADAGDRDRLGDLGHLARAVSDRHLGIGADGLILIQHSEVAAARMRMFNADGSEGEMCGNGLRCIAKYLFDRNPRPDRRIRIESASGVVDAEVVDTDADGAATQIAVTLIEPVLSAAAIPTTLPGSPPLRVPVPTRCGEQFVSCVSMGNPHCVVFCADVSDELVSTLGPELERHVAFPQRVNVGFCAIASRESVSLRVWERGSGETRACGSGACAAVVLGQLLGELAESVSVHLPGGTLQVDWQPGTAVRLTGPAVEVFAGSWKGAKPGCNGSEKPLSSGLSPNLP